MKQIRIAFLIALLSFTFLSVLTGCKKFLGLERQTDWDFNAVTLDPHINMTAWAYLKQRALGTDPADTIFKKMYDGILYAGIDSSEYTKTNRTYVFLHNDAIYRLSSNKITTDCYWGYYKTRSGKTGTSWTDYPVDSVKNWLLYLISEGNYTFETLNPVPKEVTTLLPKNADPRNPESIMTYNIDNTANYKLMINDFVGSQRNNTVRTAGILATNGPIHVVDRVVEYRTQ
jgi:hypothetical protein